MVFGASTRSYKVKVDYSKMLKAQEQALKALELEINKLENLKEDEELDVDQFKSTIGVAREDTIHVNNFPYHFEERDIRLLFKDCGEITRVAMPEDRMSKQSRGFAFITFIDYKAARKAMNLDGHRVMNRPIKVTIAQ